MEIIKKEFRKAGGEVYAIVSTDTKSKIISDTWIGEFETKENFQAVLIYIVLQIEKHNLKGWLADLREMKGSFSEASEWLSGTIMPLAIANGLLFEAIVVPKDVFARLATKDTIQKISDFEIRQFDNISLAHDWLLSQIIEA